MDEKRFERSARGARLLDELTRRGSLDLHLHTTYSDGYDTPAEMVDRVLAAGLAVFAITDHDTIDGIRPTRDALNERAAITGKKIITIEEATSPSGLPQTPYLPHLIPGVELSVLFPGSEEEVHLLAYFPYGGEEKLRPFLEHQKRTRIARNNKLVERFQDLGYPLTLSDLKPNGEHAEAFSRTHVAHWLIQRGYVPDMKTAFDTLLAEGKPGYVKRNRPTLEETMNLILQSDGVPVLAHPNLYGWCDNACSTKESNKLLEKLHAAKNLGLLGVECWHGDASKDEQRAIAKAAETLNLARTAGSDDHGRNKERI